MGALPLDPKERKTYPVVTGLLDYFPRACAYVAHISFVTTEQHHPGQPMHWERDKSPDHEDCIGRHTLERGTMDTDGLRHTGKRAWRAFAALELELEEEERNLEAVRKAQAEAEPGTGAAVFRGLNPRTGTDHDENGTYQGDPGDEDDHRPAPVDPADRAMEEMEMAHPMLNRSQEAHLDALAAVQTIRYACPVCQTEFYTPKGLAAHRIAVKACNPTRNL